MCHKKSILHKLYYLNLKSRIRETMNLTACADSSTNKKRQKKGEGDMPHRATPCSPFTCPFQISYPLLTWRSQKTLLTVDLSLAKHPTYSGKPYKQCGPPNHRTSYSPWTCPRGPPYSFNRRRPSKKLHGTGQTTNNRRILRFIEQICLEAH